MNREAYNKCMIPYMRGSKSKEQRQFDMCTGAKVCSGKAKTEDEARSICSQPKPPKQPKGVKAKKGQSCEKQVLEVSRCMADRIDMNLAHNVNSVETAIINAMMECQCQGR